MRKSVDLTIAYRLIGSGVLILIKNDVLRFMGEPEGEFMAVIPVGYAAKASTAPTKQPLEEVVKYL